MILTWPGPDAEVEVTPTRSPRRLPTIDDARRVVVQESGAMTVYAGDRVDFLAAYHRLGIPGSPTQLALRRPVLTALHEAESLLPIGFSLTVLDGCRSRRFQRQLVMHYASRFPSLEGYVSNPEDTELVPPHTTGGAVDLTLSHLGSPLALGTDFDDFSEAAHFDARQGGPDGARVERLRECFYDALLRAGFAPYPLEWWHWSLGDQWWAAYYGEPIAPFGEVLHEYVQDGES